MPSHRKRVRPRGNVGSLPNSSSTSNLICFFYCFSSVGVGASCCCTLLWDLWDLNCRWRSLREWLSHLSAGQDCGRLGEGDWCLLGHWGEALWWCLNQFLIQEHCLLDPSCPVEWSSLGPLADSTNKAQLRENGPMRQNTCRSVSCFLQWA